MSQNVSNSMNGKPVTPGSTVHSGLGNSTHGGKVVHDSRGNAIWDWAIATGVLAGSHAAELLRLLDNPALAVHAECGAAGEWAGDPYNRR